VVQADAGFGSFSPDATSAVARVRGVHAVAAVRFAQTRVGGEKHGVTGIDPRTFASLYHSDWKQGSDATLAALVPGQVVVSKSYAESKGTKVGQDLRLETPLHRTIGARVTGVIDDKGGLTGELVLPNSVVERDFGLKRDGFVLVGFDRGVSQPAVMQGIRAALASQHPDAKALTNAQFIKDRENQVNQLLALIYALLALAIIVSLFGIVNTLVLSITERTRELGLLRAVGMSRRQVRRVIRYEAVITAMIGGIVGLGVGVVLAVLITQAIDGFKLAIPVGQLIVVLILAGIAGVVAAVLPARRASRLDVLEALSYE
jgi:putative ABC transport system permease protein